MPNFTVEYAVQMKCDACKNKIVNELSTLNNVLIKDINVQEQRLVIEFDSNNSSVFQIQDILEKKLGLSTIIRGTGNFVSAVTEVHGSRNYPNVIGVVRYIQNEDKLCLLDAVIDGLDANRQYKLGVHEYGDLTDPSYTSIGDEIYSFGTTYTNSPSKLIVKKSSPNCDLLSFIGRAFAIRNENTIFGAGVIARSSKIMDNTKKVCACSGKTLWEEKNDHKVNN